MDIEDQFIVLFAGLSGLLNNVNVSEISELEDYILYNTSKYEFYDENASVGVIHQQLASSLVDVIKE